MTGLAVGILAGPGRLFRLFARAGRATLGGFGKREREYYFRERRANPWRPQPARSLHGYEWWPPISGERMLPPRNGAPAGLISAGARSLSVTPEGPSSWARARSTRSRRRRRKGRSLAGAILATAAATPTRARAGRLAFRAASAPEKGAQQSPKRAPDRLRRPRQLASARRQMADFFALDCAPAGQPS